MLAQTLQKTMTGTVRRQEPMARHTTWRVGGPAELFIVPADREALQMALQLLEAAGCPWLVCGYGSNVLVRDGGIDGAVVHTGGLRKMQLHADGKIEVEAGVPLMKLVRECVRRGYGGLESLAGMPATVGGAVAMNAGAHGQQIGDVLEALQVCNAAGCRELPADACELAYRHCRIPEKSIVAQARLQLNPCSPEQLQKRMREVLAARREAQSVGGANAGSVFKNPEGKAAWRLIDAAGMRGVRRGGARVSEKHTNFIINDGTASASEIEALINAVVDAVAADSGIRLQPEVRIWGRTVKTGNA